MPTTEGYNGAYTGQQIDAAIAKANAALLAPDGGTEGQILEKTTDGSKWVDKPVMYVNVTGSGNPYTSDKSLEEVKAAYETGSAVSAVFQSRIFKLSALNPSNVVFSDALTTVNTLTLASNKVVILQTTTPSARNTTFEPTGSITSDNVQDAIEELAGKFPKPASVTLTASSWSSNTQTVTVSGAKATGQNVRLSPVTKSDADAWASAGCWCTAQGANSLTFTCETVPTQDIELNVEMQEVQS